MAALVLLILLVWAAFHWPVFFLVLIVLGCLSNRKETQSVGTTFQHDGCFSFLPTPAPPVTRQPKDNTVPQITHTPPGREHYALSERLLTASLVLWRQKFEELFVQPRPVSGEMRSLAYDDYAADAVRQLKCCCTMLGLNFAELGKAWETKNSGKIREACDGINFACEQLYEWSLKMRSLEPPSWESGEHARRERMAEDVFRQVEQTVNRLRTTVHDPDCSGTVTLNANFYPPFDLKYS